MKTARRTAQERATNALVKKTVVQLLFSTAQAFTVDGLREKLREFFRQETPPESRAAAALSTVELISVLLEANKELAETGLALKITNGVVSLSTAKVHPRPAEYLAARAPRAEGDLTESSLEVLACVAFRQPVSQAGIDRLCGADRRRKVAELKQMNLVESCDGPDGRKLFATTETFLLRFNYATLEEFKTDTGKKWNAGALPSGGPGR